MWPNIMPRGPVLHITAQNTILDHVYLLEAMVEAAGK